MKAYLLPVRVQGAGAEPEIAAAVRAWSGAPFNGLPPVDVLIVGRGGGSIEDFWNFNEETVARAIYECTVPVISAVGHDTDFTIADFVADLRAPTPTAACLLYTSPSFTAPPAPDKVFTVTDRPLISKAPFAPTTKSTAEALLSIPVELN